MDIKLVTPIVREKPILLIMLLPINILLFLSFRWLPDFSEIASLINLPFLHVPNISSYNSTIVYVLILLFIFGIYLALNLLVVPAALELLVDKICCNKTQPGWYKHGLKRNWKKTLINFLIRSLATLFKLFIIYILFKIFITFYSIDAISNEPIINDENSLLTLLAIVFLFFLAIIYTGNIIFDTSFMLLLPALYEYSIIDTFHFLFRKEVISKACYFAKTTIFIKVIPSLVYITVSTLLILTYSISVDTTDLLAAIYNYIRSWTSITMLVMFSMLRILILPCQFIVYHKFKREETLGL